MSGQRFSPPPWVVKMGEGVYFGILAQWLFLTLFAVAILLFLGEERGTERVHARKSYEGGSFMPSISESNLPGVGRKFQIETTSGDRLTIIIHDDGRRELYHFLRHNLDRAASVVTLQDSEARQVAGIIGGLTYVPKALPSAEIVLDDLVLEWFTIPKGAVGSGKTIREMAVRTRTGASIVSIFQENRPSVINPEADTRLREGATLIVAGDRKSIRALKDLLIEGRSP